ncbi:hypothetical protein [Sphingobium yanoikuyae]|uniref:hypothetical protein n=1 Tax=Sphingobium yanoikuyae TaxID=13690 RepID=UPI0035C7D8F8
MKDETDLVAAVLLGDMSWAQMAIEDLRLGSEKWRQIYSKGHAIAFPPEPLPPLAEALTLPVPDHLPGSTMGDPRKRAA